MTTPDSVFVDQNVRAHVGHNFTPMPSLLGLGCAPHPSRLHSSRAVARGLKDDGLSRWGDYSSMAIDPTDDCTFWYTNEYLKTTGSFNWDTRIVKFKFNSCQ